jgi:glycosyltransferase involved in cell wall biosynthesis
MSMRITIVQGAFLPIPPVLGGAVEKIWFGLAQEFARRGHRVTHISQQHKTLKREEVMEGVHHIRIPGFEIPGSLLRLKWRDLVYSLRTLRVLPEADVIVTNTFWLPIIAPKIKRGRIYVHIARYPKGQIKFYRKAARLQTVSTAVGEAVRKEAPVLSSRVRVIPNFVPQLGCNRDIVREKSILYVGRVHPEKGIHLLVEAFERLVADGVCDWKLRIVGPWQVNFGGGGGGYFHALRRQSQKLGNLVEWIGPVFDTEALHTYYRQSKVFAYPSLAERGETFGLAPLEAMAAGCPPVVSALECFKDFVKPGINGWTFDHCASAGATNLTAALRNAITAVDTLPGIRDNAMETARVFSLTRVADQYLKDFEEIVAA